MARISVLKNIIIYAAGYGDFSFSLPKGKLLHVAVCNITNAGTDWTAELSMQREEFGSPYNAALMHHELQSLANKNVEWEPNRDWNIDEPMRWLNVRADSPLTVGDALSVTVVMEVP